MYACVDDYLNERGTEYIKMDAGGITLKIHRTRMFN